MSALPAILLFVAIGIAVVSIYEMTNPNLFLDLQEAGE